jgi:hypothetical protein
MSKFEKLQKEVGEWSRDNFPGQPDVNPLIGSSEEMGELVDRIDDQQVSKEEIDAVGDIVVYLADFCEIRGLSLQESYDMIDDVEREYQDFLREWTDSYGKLARSVLKQRQGIRLDEDRVGREAELRNLSRILNCLEDFADERGYSVEGC